ncbi:MAG: DNA polymerase [Thermotogota bacterium]|nr:DNA polymerase [Thermotogota bacterium]
MIIPKIPSTPSKKSKESSFDALAVECPPTDNINSAIIAMVGEAPSDIELLKGEPFVGPAGSQFNRICAAVRLARYQIYLTNACKAKLPNNKTDKLWTAKGYRHPAWGELQRLLIDELSNFPGKLIMLLGATPMKLLIDEPRFDYISKYRGSFYPAETFPHLKEKLAGKIIGFSFHPSHTMSYGQPVHFYTMIADFSKALRIIENPDLLQDNTEIKINPTFEEIQRFYALVKTKEHTAFDIEATPEFITCFSLAVYHDDKIISMSIPFLNNQGNMWSPEEEVKIWLGLAEILNDPNIKKICQNGMFDLMFILRTMNIKTDNFFFDTMLAQHRCYTELPKGLDYLTSTYTYYPYYKDEGKQSHLKVIKDWPQYWQYNAKDSAYLLPIAEALIKELEEFESTDSMTYMMELHKPLMEMEFNGILTDKQGIINARKKYERYINALQHGLNKLAGKELNPNSSKQMIAYFYGICMIKPYVNRKTGNASCDTVALHRIAKKNIKGSIEARMIIKIRKYRKLVSTYFEVPVDDDNRLRCSHKITGTVSGRIATERTFFGTGCLLPDAEVLTPNGWLKFKYFQSGMQAMQWDDKTNELSWCVPKLHKEFYDSKMMNLSTTQTSGIFTADHRIPTRHPFHKTLTVKSAYDTSNLSERLLPLSGMHKGYKELPPLLLRLLAMVQADCTIEQYNIRCSFKKKRKINRFLKLMEIGQIDFTEQKGISGYRKFCISSEWTALIAKFLLPNKTFGTWMYDLTLEAKEAFIDELKYWDAHQRGQSFIYYTTNKTNVEIVSTLVHLIGKSCTITINTDNNNGYGSGNNKDLYAVNIKPRDHARINKQHWSMFDYTGNVYCLQTPTSFFLVRQNGNIQITGNTNLQNQPYLFKYFLISDPDWILCEVDLAKAEAHVVAYLTQDTNMIESFESGIDVHSFNASKIFNVPIEEIIHEAKTKKVDQKSTMRYMGKKVVHASNYSMGPQTFSDNLAVEEIFMSQSECKKLLQNYQDRFPGLKRWHRLIEEEVQNSRILYNLFNTPRRFLGDMGPALFRNAYSYKPQSTVAELLNRGMIKCANDQRLGKDGFDIRMLTTVHDSMVFQFHKNQIPNLLQILLIIKDHMTYTFTHKGRSFTIGLDAKIGQQWAGKTAEIASFTQEYIDEAIKKIGV